MYLSQIAIKIPSGLLIQTMSSHITIIGYRIALNSSYLMFSLQFSISNLTNLLIESLALEQLVTLRYGPLQTDIKISEGMGGKKLIFQMSNYELQDLFYKYACGLFIRNNQGKFFCILSLESIQVGVNIENFPILFLNNQRKRIYEGKVNIVLKQYQPRVPKRQISPIRDQNQNAANHLGKQAPQYLKPTLNSFLYGTQVQMNNKQVRPDIDPKYSIQTLQAVNNPNSRGISYNTNHGSRYKQKDSQKRTLERPQHPQVTNCVYQHPEQQFKVVKNSQVYPKGSLGWDSRDMPPTMEFTNDGDNDIGFIPIKGMTIPSVLDMHPYPNIPNLKNKFKLQQPTLYQPESQQRIPIYASSDRQPYLLNQIVTTQHQNTTLVSKNPYQQSIKHSKNLSIPTNVRQKISRQQIRKMAIEDIQKDSKTGIMIPIIKGNSYQLVPLASLSRHQIIEYVQKQKIQQNSFSKNKQNAQQTPDKNAHHLISKSKKNSTPLKRPESAHANLARKMSVQNQIKEEQHHYESQNYDQDYQSDFQSISIVNSAIRSKSWKKKQLAMDESINNDEGYSQDFESYSQSMLSRTQQKHHSVSQIGQSIKSISQSYRAK